MLTRIHRDNPQRLFINRFTTNPSALSLVHDHKCHTFRLLKKTGKKTYSARSDTIVFGMFSCLVFFKVAVLRSISRCQ